MRSYYLSGMTQVKIEKEIAEDLINSKLRVLQQYVDRILNRWNESSAEIFLVKARSGVHKNAEEDAVELRQLLLDLKKFQDLLKKL